MTRRSAATARRDQRAARRDSSGRRGTRSAWGDALWIAGLAALLRAVYLVGASQSPLFHQIQLDALINDRLAWGLASGAGAEPGPHFRPPGYTWFLAAIYTLFGHDLWAPRLVQAALGIGTALVVCGIAREIGGRRAGIIAGVLAALYGPFLFFDGELVSSSLEMFLFAAALWLTLVAGRRRGAGPLLGAGLALGAAVVTRPTYLPVAIPALAWLAARGPGALEGARGAGASGALSGPRAAGATAGVRAGHAPRLARLLLYSAAVLLLPLVATVRNGIVGGDWVFVASQGGINFYIGNNLQSDGTTPYVPGRGTGIASTYDAPAKMASEAEGRALRPSEVSAYWFRQGFEIWARQPLRAIALTARKIALVWNRRELPNNQDQQFFAPHNSWLFRFPWLPGFYWIAPVGLVGLWTERRGADPRRGGRWGALLLLGVAAIVTLVVAAFFVCDRFRLPLAVPLLAGAGLGLDRFLDAVLRAARPGPAEIASASIAAARSRPRVVVALLLAAAAVSLPYPRLQKTESGMSWFRLATAYEKEGEPLEAERAYARAESEGFGTAEFYNNWGLFEMRTRRAFQAEAHLRRALQIDPAMGPARGNLGELYIRQEKWELAAQELSLAAPLLPEKTAELYTTAGGLYAGIGKPQLAVEMYRRALASRPGFAPAITGLAKVQR